MHAIRRRLDDDDDRKFLRRDDVSARVQRVLVCRPLRPWLGVRYLGSEVVRRYRRTCVMNAKSRNNMFYAEFEFY